MLGQVTLLIKLQLNQQLNHFQRTKILIVDTGSIIKGLKLEKFGNDFYTVAEVLNEIKDSKSKHILSMLPFELKIREPSLESLNMVKSYAKKTGDYNSLSKVDLKVLALTYMFENELNGQKNIKKLEKRDLSGDKKAIVQFFSKFILKNKEISR